MPLVSVIIPYFKKKKSITYSVESVLKQTFQNFEIILVYDDIKLDDYQFLKRNYENNKKIKIIKNSQNIGAGLSRNVGIKNSNSELLAFLDADDFWLPNKLEQQINFMNKNKYDFVFCSYKKKFLNNNIIDVQAQKDKLDYYDLLSSCEIGLSTVILRKQIILNDIFPNLKTQEDYVAWLRITKNKIYAYNLKKNLVIWNEVANSLSSNLFQKLLDAFKVYFIYEKFNIFKSIYLLIRLCFNSLKRKF
tara:strand:- start:312 stop:1055 length:744 start_codon:yes stop_codon:yes gene_type:complete